MSPELFTDDIGSVIYHVGNDGRIGDYRVDYLGGGVLTYIFTFYLELCYCFCVAEALFLKRTVVRIQVIISLSKNGSNYFLQCLLIQHQIVGC